MALEDALERATRRRSRIRTTATSEPARAKVVTVVSPKGGAGKTVTTTNIAVGLGRVAPNEVVVVDLDVQFGDVANALRLTPETTIADVARSAAVDATTVKAFLTPHPGNFFVLCAPETPAEADMLKPELVGETIDLLAQMFRFVVIDTAAGLDEMTLTAIEHSTDLVVMCATDVSSARGLRKELDAFEILGFTTQRRHFALNRSDARVGLDAEDIKSTVGLDVAVSIPSSRMVPTAMNQGTPVLELEQRSPVARAFADLVAQVADLSTSPQPVATGGGLFRRVKEMR